jgi:lauroyl/myristoyl acyltransferase
MVDPPRLSRALHWVSAHRVGVRVRASSLVALLVNRGRFLAWATGICGSDLGGRQTTVRIDGRARLDEAAARGGVLLVTFHLGPGSTGRALRECGYSVVVGGAGFRFVAPDPPAAWDALPPLIRVPWRDTDSRATAMYELARALRRGSVVVLPADALDGGRVEFSLPLFGRLLDVHSGWFTLRRLTKAPTLLVLHSWSQEGRMVTVYPPLPPPVADVEGDRIACHRYLLDVLRPFVSAHPEQCVSLALWSRRLNGLG